jgi:cytochrome b561
VADNRWSRETISLHWLAALVLVSLTAIGKYMVDLPPSAASRLWLSRLHVLLGCVLLVLTAARLWFRVVRPAPPAPPAPKLQVLGLRAAHVALYVLTLGVVASGLTTAADTSWVSYLKGHAAEAPALAMSAARAVHENLAFSLLSLLALHIGAVMMVELQYGKTLVRILPEGEGTHAPKRQPR